MRKLASFKDPAYAQALNDVLRSADIASELRSGDSDPAGNDLSRTIWIMSELDLPRAHDVMEEFAGASDTQRARASRELSQPPPPQLAPQTAPRKSLRQRAIESPVTATLIVTCIVVAALTGLGTQGMIVNYFTIVGFERTGSYVRWSGYRDLLNGQVWRLFTPALIHFGPFHLLFNAFWLNDLGAPTERYQGSWRFAGFLLWSAAISNLAQLQFGDSPNFGGLSGVIYALVGYLWARGHADPSSGIALPNRLVLFFVAWMALGFSGLLKDVIGSMANYCHLGGFAAGALYGYVAALVATTRPSR
jgi:GlpG protein